MNKQRLKAVLIKVTETAALLAATVKDPARRERLEQRAATLRQQVVDMD